MVCGGIEKNQPDKDKEKIFLYFKVNIVLTKFLVCKGGILYSSGH